MLSIRYYGDPVLRKKARPVEVFDDSLRLFVESMVETMCALDGVGLAAPQVGHSIQCAVIDTTSGAEKPLVLINPVFTFKSEDRIQHEEGCLSFPDLQLMITRPKIVSVKAFDETGYAVVIENAGELLARALQHEIDHLDGLLFIDHVSLLQRKLLKGKLKKITEFQHRAPESDVNPEDR